jgi:uncharacterized protein YndB with AHSA1/START domain
MATTSTRTSRHVKARRADVYRALIDARAVATWMVPIGITSHVNSVTPDTAFRPSSAWIANSKFSKLRTLYKTLRGSKTAEMPGS